MKGRRRFGMELALDSTCLPRRSVAATMLAVVANEASDGELISRAADGDRGAFEVLYRRYSRPVFGLALRRLGDRGRAEDAVQETFASVWRAARSYRPERGPGAPWLYAVARNAITDRSRVRSEPPAEPPEEPSTEAGPPERAEAGWTAWRAHRGSVHVDVQGADARDAARPGRVGDDSGREARPERQLAPEARRPRPEAVAEGLGLRDVPDASRPSGRDVRHLRDPSPERHGAAERALQP